MDFNFFSDLSIDAKSDEEKFVQLQNYQQLANQLKQRYTKLKNLVPKLDDSEDAKAVSFSLSIFENRFRDIQKEVSFYLNEKDRNIGEAEKNIRLYGECFGDIEEVYEVYEQEGLLLIPDIETYNDIRSYMVDIKQEQSEYINSLNAQWVKLQNQLSSQIDQGVATLLEVKLNLGITGAFKDQITDEIKKHRKHEKLYFAFFVVSLLLIPSVIVGLYFIDNLESLSWQDLLLIKLSVALPLIWIARWFSKNYAHARLAVLKFDHLNRLLGEGANTIAKLVESDPDAKSEVYKRFAELFLDIKDLESIAMKQPAHPIEDLRDLLELKRKYNEQ